MVILLNKENIFLCVYFFLDNNKKLKEEYDVKIESYRQKVQIRVEFLKQELDALRDEFMKRLDLLKIEIDR